MSRTLCQTLPTKYARMYALSILVKAKQKGTQIIKETYVCNDIVIDLCVF